jgi:hypothetical protein
MLTIKLLLLAFSSIGYMSFFYCQSKIALFKVPFVYCCTASLFIYFFSLLGLLQIGIVIFIGIGCGLSIFILIKNIQYVSLTRYDIKSMIIFLPFIVFYFSISNNFKFLLWDEFSFWASSTKIIFETNALFNESSPIFLKSYPPIQQLFQYFIVKLSFWSEKNVLFAQTFWVLSALMCVAGAVVKNRYNACVTFLISCSFLYFFNYTYSSIYSDPLLGMVFAASIALAYDQSGKVSSIFTFFLSIAVLLLIKEIAILLALIALLIFTASIYLSYFRFQKYGLTRTCSMAFVGLVTLFITYKSWAWYVAKIHATREIHVPSLSTFFGYPINERLSTTLLELIHRVSAPGYLNIHHVVSSFSPSIILVVAGLSLLSVLLLIVTTRENRILLGTTLLIVFAGFFTYIAALFLSYLLFFTEYEGVRLASFERYLSSYTLAWALLLYALSAELFAKVSNKYLVVPQLAIAAISLFFVPKAYFSDMVSIDSVGESMQLKNKIDDFASTVKAHIKHNEKVYFIAQNTNGLERVMFYYAMLPYTTSMSWCWSLGKKYFDGDVWTCDNNLTGFLDGFSYLAVYRGDAQLWQSAQGLFNDADTALSTPALFKINRSNGKIESFERLK